MELKIIKFVYQHLTSAMTAVGMTYSVITTSNSYVINPNVKNLNIKIIVVEEEGEFIIEVWRSPINIMKHRFILMNDNIQIFENLVYLEPTVQYTQLNRKLSDISRSFKIAANVD